MIRYKKRYTGSSPKKGSPIKLFFISDFLTYLRYPLSHHEKKV